MTNIQQVIIKARKKTKLSRLKFAELLECSEAYISYLERGEKVPSIQFLEKVAEVIGDNVNVKITSL